MILTAGVAVLHAVATVTAEMIDVMAVEMTDVTTVETIDVTTAVIDATGINIINGVRKNPFQITNKSVIFILEKEQPPTKWLTT